MFALQALMSYVLMLAVMYVALLRKSLLNLTRTQDIQRRISHLYLGWFGNWGSYIRAMERSWRACLGTLTFLLSFYTSVLVRCGWDPNFRGRKHLCFTNEVVNCKVELAQRHDGLAKYCRR